jgi:hypothetical protein
MLTTSSKPRILLIDIETLPAVAYIWNMYDDGVPLERLIAPGRMACAAFKWHGEKGITFVAEWHEGGRPAMLTKVRDALDEADAVVTYNGNKFDFLKLRGEFVSFKIRPPAPITSIDLYQTVRKLGFVSGKLEFVAPFLQIGKKVKHEGFKLWRLVMEGDEKARVRMERYNKQDTRLLGGLYNYLKPYIETHPHLHDNNPNSCPVCGSHKVQRRGYRRTRTMRIERLQCQVDGCGAWFTGKRSKIK